ncbi:MAG: histone deacetylase family protein [Acidimicrobiia bacterium]
MIVFYDQTQEVHDPSEPHMFGGELSPPAETAERAKRILRALEGGGFRIVAPEIISRDLLLEVHSDRYLRFLESAHARWRVATKSSLGDEAVAYIRPIPGTPWKEPTSVLAEMGRYSNDVDPILHGTWPAIIAGASCAEAAASASMEHGVAYALTRPPGHHAARETYGGYCYINNAAVAASRLRRDLDRVAILDVDTHHGNGTQSIFWDRGDVLTVSIHGDTTEHFPFFLGHEDERGEGDGRGRNRNYPLPTGSKWARYWRALESSLELISSFDAEGLVVALGVDTHKAHGVLALAGEDFAMIGSGIRSLGIPTVFVQEGGYEPGTLEEAVPAVLRGFTDA